MSQTSSTAPSLRTSALIVAALLAVPALYVASRWKPSRAVQATALPAQSESPLAAAEDRVRTQPTVANRIDLSQAYIQAKMYGRAIQVLTPLVAEAPLNPIAWNNLCVARMLQLEYSLAIEACNHGAAADPSFQLVHNNLRWAEGERDKTVAALAEQEKTDPAKRDTAFYLAEGLNQLHLGSYDQALVAWHRALQLDPQNALAWNNIGTAQMMQHQYTEAHTSFQRAIALDPENQLTRNNLAWAEETLKTAP